MAAVWFGGGSRLAVRSVLGRCVRVLRWVVFSACYPPSSGCRARQEKFHATFGSRLGCLPHRVGKGELEGDNTDLH